MNNDALKKRILAARGKIPSDLVLKGGRVVNVFSGDIQEKDVAVYDGVFVGTGTGYSAQREVDVSGKWLVPGLIDGHIHIESSMLIPSGLAAALLPHGTTAIVADPHEIANVMGIEGIRFMLDESKSIPFDIFFMAPSCVPATHLETAGACIGRAELSTLREEPRILGLAEMMNFPGVLEGDEEVLEKIRLFSGRVLDGHCPMLEGMDLQAYLAAGIRSDHETANRSEALEKLAGGMMIMIREGTSAKNLDALLPLVSPSNERSFCFVSDDLHPEDILDRGHLDFMVKRAMKFGLNPITAIRLATLNPAQYFGLRDRGAIAPGYRADLAVLDDLERFEVVSVYKDGRLTANQGEPMNFQEQKAHALPLARPLNAAPLTLESLRIPHSGGKARVMELVPGQITTRMIVRPLKADGQWVASDTDADILKLCVVERHERSGRVGLGMVKGFGLKRGAIASSVAHDSHNIISAGVSDHEILEAVESVREMGGGLSVVLEQEVLASVPLEIAGLMSTESLKVLAERLGQTKKAALGLGCTLEEPFMALSFLALPVIPELKLTDRGLVDVAKFETVPLFSDE
jgi:adenine deaminase